MEPGNPFDPIQPATQQFFAGRGAELAQMAIYLRNTKDGAPTNVYLLGRGGCGKTSFLFRIRDQEGPENDLCCVYLYIDENHGRNLRARHLMYNLIEQMLITLSDRLRSSDLLDQFRSSSQGPHPLFKIPQVFLEDRLTTADVEADLRAILNRCETEGIPGVVILIDEGQNLLNYEDGGEFLYQLRGAIQSLGRGYTIVLSCLADDGMDVIEELESKRGYQGLTRFFGNVLRLGGFTTDDEAKEAIRRRLQGSRIQFPEDLLDTIVQVCERDPQQMMFLCHDVYNIALLKGQAQIQRPMLDEVIDRRFSREVAHGLSNLASLLPTEKETLQRLVQIGGRVSILTMAKFYCGEGNEGGIKRIRPRLQGEFHELCRRGLCVEESSPVGTFYRITSPLLHYILQRELRRTALDDL